MKISQLLVFMYFSFFLLAACSTSHYPSKAGLPPGHAKKLAGQKSAKNFAPGQVKKRH